MSKYKAKRTEVDGIVFHSQKEARRYQELKLLQRAGKIRNLRLQPEWDLFVPGGERIGAYIADFCYYTVPWDYEQPELVVEDVKGFKTPLYRWKKKHVEAQYGITIRET